VDTCPFEAGQQYGIPLYEETITQDLLLDISTALPGLQVKTFSKQKESRNGADWQWEWWFQGAKWFGLRVQAKRLIKQSANRLGYSLGYKTTSGRRQIDLLIADAEQSGMQAAFVLYNGPELANVKMEWGCRRLPPKIDFFGVSLLPARPARDLLDTGSSDPATICGMSRPWSCLAACTPSECFWAGDEMPILASAEFRKSDIAEEIALRFRRLEAQAIIASKDSYPPDIGSSPRNIPGLMDAPPSHITGLLRNGISSATRLPTRVRSVTVIRDAT
jgi:hypothetical protein